jgi:Cyclophilin type peptidyl-prolyl cis-trans isomerase/CLD
MILNSFFYLKKDFILQTGDPTGTGRGGESAYGLAYGDQAKFFEQELIPKIKHRKLGAVSMINNGDNKHGSQVSCGWMNWIRVLIFCAVFNHFSGGFGTVGQQTYSFWGSCQGI